MCWKDNPLGKGEVQSSILCGSTILRRSLVPCSWALTTLFLHRVLSTTPDRAAIPSARTS